MTRRELRNGILFLLALLLIIGVLASRAYAQSPRNVYGEADFATRDNYTRDGLVACWDFLDAEPYGDTLQNIGHFESWQGTSGGCTNCPVGWVCDCITNGGDLNQETAIIHNGNSSLRLETTALLGSILAYTFTFPANKYYQASFCYRGIDGTEDFYFLVGNSTLTDTYNFATDTFTVPFTAYAVTNAATSWTCVNLYMAVGGIQKTNYLIGFTATTADGTGVYIDNVKFKELRHPAPVSDTGIALTMPVTSDPSFGDCKTCQSFRGQSTDLGTGFDGVDDYMSIPDASGGNVFDPAGSFSTMVVFSTDLSVAKSSLPIAKFGAAGQRSWGLASQVNGDLTFYVLSDGTTLTAASKAGAITKNCPSCVVATYQFVGSGTSIGNIYANELAAGTASNLAGPPFNSTAAFSIGADANGFTRLTGTIRQTCYWNKSLSVIEANKVRNPYFPGNDNGPGFYVSSCTQAASHATCSHKNCRDGTPTACQAEGTGSMAVFGQYTGIQDNNSFETNTSTQDNPTFTGFTYTENAGDGTANVSQYFGDSKHGASSLRIKLTGTTSYAFTGSTCNAMLPNTAYYAYVAAKHLNGKRPTNARVYVLEYSDAGCTLNLVSNSGTMSNLVTPSWKDYGVSFTSAATTNFYKIGFEARDGNSDTLFDNLDLKAASHHTPWVRVPSGGGAVTYNIRDYKLFNPLSSYVQSEGGFAYASGFCLGGWVYTDWAGDDGVTHYIAAVPGTVGNNNSWHISKNSSNRVQFILHDSAGTFRYTFYTVTNVEWTSGNWKYIEICSNNTDNILQLRHYNVNNSTWYTAVTTYDTGTGVQNGQANYISVGSSLAAVPLNGYIRNLTIGPYNAIWPMLGWNNGRIPAARPY